MTLDISHKYLVPKSSKILVLGSNGLAGGAICRELLTQSFTNLLTPSSNELDLTDRLATIDYFHLHKPEVVIVAAAKVGGINANAQYPYDFISQNLQIQTNVFDAAVQQNVPRLLFLGSSCIYPKFAKQPISEDQLLTGLLEQTNDAYAIAKIAGIMQVIAARRQFGHKWISLMPTNLYGPGDNFHPEHSHVLPALIRRFHEAKVQGQEKVTIWGTGSPRREFLHTSDLAKAVIFCMENYDSEEIINIGFGQDISIAELAQMTKKIVGFKGEIDQDTSKPDGTPRKLLDISKLERLGWKPFIPLEEGLRSTYEWYEENLMNAREL